MGRRPQKLELTWFNKDKALIPTEKGKYGYTWVDPKDPRYCETHTLVVDDVVRGEQAPKQNGVNYSERADLKPSDDNLLIRGESGDVLEALTRVPEWANKYVGQVKCIYIDPPFNTAQTFANYEDNLEHSIWLTMMRDRLVNLRKLLSTDGSIWVHLDDVENHRMRSLMDEVFGAGNFVAEVRWQKSDTLRNDSGTFSEDFDTILIFVKSRPWEPNRLPRPESMNSHYGIPDGDDRRWFNPGPTAPGAKTHQGMVYAIQNPITGVLHYPLNGRCWALGQNEILRDVGQYAEYELRDIDDASARASICGVEVEEVREGVRGIVLKNGLQSSRERAMKRVQAGKWPTFHFSSNGKGYPAKKAYIPLGGIAPRTWWPHTDVGSNRTSKAEIRALFPELTPFTTPKPERLMERIVHIATNPGDIVLDVFAGSGTTAAVAQKMGRRWVACELVADTVSRFTRPRLERVVRGEDLGGITQTKGQRVDATDEGLPTGLSAEDAQKFTSLLNKTIIDEDDLKKDAAILRLKSLVKTKKSPDVINWRGGGGFTVAHLSPTCFDYDPDFDLVALTDVATGAVLIESVAANLNFRRTREHRTFHGIRGAMRLAVVEGRLDQSKVDDLIAHLGIGEGLTIAATEIDDGVRQYLRTLGRGCRAIHIPGDMFTYSAAEEN